MPRALITRASRRDASHGSRMVSCLAASAVGALAGTSALRAAETTPDLLRRALGLAGPGAAGALTPDDDAASRGNAEAILLGGRWTKWTPSHGTVEPDRLGAKCPSES